MKLNFKIMGLVIMVTMILVISTLAYHITRVKEEKLFNFAYHQNTSISIQSILNFRQQSLEQNLEDNSAWDVMVDFVKKPDTVWAQENLATSRKTLGLDFIQVYDLGYRLSWACYNPETQAAISQVLSKEKLRKIFSKKTTCHFYEITDAGLLELYGSIIVSSIDIERKTAPNGYLFFGKLWSKEVLSDLENSSNSFISLHYLNGKSKDGAAHTIQSGSKEILVFLKDYDNNEIARLDFISKSFFETDTRWFYLFTLIPFALALIVLAGFYFLISRWITFPVRKITQSLDSQDSGNLKLITSDNIEFYKIAGLLAESFENKKTLEKEVAERKKAEERIIRFAEELQEINTSKDKFFSILAHDLKSPFHYLLGYSDLLKNEYPTLSDEDRKKFIGIIHSNSQRLYNLLENLLEWSRLQTGRIEFEMEVFDLARELKQLSETVRASANHKNLTLDASGFDQAIIKADRNMIRSAMHNMLTNAIKYTPDGGTVSVKTQSGDTHVEICIQDSGIGMTPEEVSKLFRIDVSFSRPGTNKEPGTGLGLILTKEFIEKNNGKLFVDSMPDKGSLFRVTLPLYKA